MELSGGVAMECFRLQDSLREKFEGGDGFINGNVFI